MKVSVVGTYTGAEKKWAIGRFPNEDGTPGIYRLGVLVEGGVNFSKDKTFTSREEAEGHLIYHVDTTVKLYR
jgi:hypothetical protein